MLAVQHSALPHHSSRVSGSTLISGRCGGSVNVGSPDFFPPLKNMPVSLNCHDEGVRMELCNELASNPGCTPASCLVFLAIGSSDHGRDKAVTEGRWKRKINASSGLPDNSTLFKATDHDSWSVLVLKLTSPRNQNGSFSINTSALRLFISSCALKQWRDSHLEDIRLQNLLYQI